MTKTFAKLAAVCGTAAVLAGAAAMPANALYLGYGNGDPGDCGDFWAFQRGCKPAPQAQVPATAPTGHAYHTAHRYARTHHHPVTQQRMIDKNS